MKTLTQTWELIQLLSSLHFLSPSLVRSVSPQTYTLNCVYSEEEVDNSEYLDRYIKHIKACRNSNCSYYQKLIDITGRMDGETRGAAMLGVTHFAMWFAADVVAPLTGGISMIVAGVLSAGAFLGGDVLIENNIRKNVKEVENELKEKWENEQKN